MEFVKGEQYTNRRGTFTVLEISPPNMRVRFESGVEETLNMAIQRRIISNMTLPPRTPEPPPRRKILSGSRAPAKATPSRARGAGGVTAPRRTPAAPAAAADAPADAPAAVPAARATRRAASRIPATTLTQLIDMTEKDQQAARLDLVRATLASAATFLGVIERSREAEPGPFQAFTAAHVSRLNAAGQPPTRQEPAQLLGFAIAQNRAYLAAEGQEILAWRFPLYELGMERYLIDLLCYEESTRRAMLVCTRIKTTGRHWLWETLLDSLRTWVAVGQTPTFAAALEDHALDAPPMLVVVAPVAFWGDNAPGAGAHTAEVTAGHDLNGRLVAAMEDWLGITVLLLQVPDTWLRTVDDLDHPPISPAPFIRPAGHG